ncbi:MAG: ABC transporter ATP-binding protein [Clostridiaceae bacterium]|nr:ABC transporter ATP-binding protein [Clostridiaceae bacterium]
MIEVKDAVKRFDGFAALDGACLRADMGSVYGLVGPNGAGKSTLLRVLAGVCRPDAGDVLLDGQPVYESPAVKQRVAFIPDELYYFVSATTADMRRFYKGIYPKFDDQRYARLGEVFALDERQPIRRMSRGMQKQAAFRLALSLRPEVLLLDEPVDGLDPVMRRQLWSILMADVTENGTTVLVSSHNLRELEDVCDRIGVLHRGKMLLERDLAQLQDGICKLQYVGEVLPDGLPVLHTSASGKVRTLIVRGNADAVSAAAEQAKPVFYDVLPLTLEEIFIYELGGEDYAVRDIVV